MRTTPSELNRMLGQPIFGSDGEKVGKISDVYEDQSTGRPEWLAVKTGWFGGRVSFVPLDEAQIQDDGVHVPFDKEMVKGAPTADTEGILVADEERALYEHYGRGGGYWSPGEQTTGQQRTGRPDAGRTDDAMTRSEEELRVGTSMEQTGQARLRKWVDTEDVSDTATVRREEARVVREPITEGNVGEATSGPDIRESSHDMTLNEERLVVGKETVPKERVRLEKEVIEEEQPVEADLRKERIEPEGDIGRRRS